jgi:hypothetical protein
MHAKDYSTLPDVAAMKGTSETPLPDKIMVYAKVLSMLPGFSA